MSVTATATGSSVAAPSATRAPTASPIATDPNFAALHEQAEAALARWAAAVEAAGGERAVVVLWSGTGQIGDWEEQPGGSGKAALSCGLFEAEVALPTATSEGEVVWPGGAVKPVHTISAAQAVAEMRADITPGCRASLTPLLITAAELTTGEIQTDRGPATGPVWAFSLKGTAVKATRVAIAERVRLTLPEKGSGVSVELSRGRAPDRVVTVEFTGAAGAGDQPCGADYTAEAVESGLAIAVIVTEHHRPIAHPVPSKFGCLTFGAMRTATVTLAAPLGERTVLEVTEGRPVPTLAP